MIEARTPVVVVTGFLGSGKTTLVNRWLEREQDSLVIVNEFGEVPVDHFLMQGAVERTTALPNGCVCCRLRSDLEEALVGAAMRRRRGEIAGFDRVIVETSGLADPGPVAQTLFADEAVARDYRLGSIVAVVDCSDAQGRTAVPEVAKAQIAAADAVVLSKTDRASAAQVAAAREEVARLNPASSCVEGSFGDVPLAVFNSVSDTDFSKFSATAHAEGLSSFVLEFPKPVRRSLLESFLALLVELRGADLLRVKGAVPLEEEGFVLVQGMRHVFDRWRPAPTGMTPALVFITRGVGRDQVLDLWRAIELLQKKI